MLFQRLIRENARRRKDTILEQERRQLLARARRLTRFVVVQAGDHLAGLPHSVAVGHVVHGVVRRVQEEARAVVVRVEVLPARADRLEKLVLAAVAGRGAAFAELTILDRLDHDGGAAVEQAQRGDQR